MSVSEHDRHLLHTKAEETMGSDAADTLMSYLPPVGWADVVTKRDLDALEERMDLRFQLVDQRFDSMEASIDQRFQLVDQRFDSMEASIDQRFDSMEARFDQRFESTDQRFDSLSGIFATKADLASQTRSVILGVAALNLSFGGLALGIVQLLR